MTWIIMKAYDGRGGFIDSEAPEWKANVGVHERADASGIFKGDPGRLDPAQMPARFVIPRKRKSFPDLWWGSGGLFVISGALRDLIEAHDPGLHQIWPMEMVTKRDEPYPGTFFGLSVVGRAAAITEEGSHVHVQEAYDSPATATTSAYHTPRRATLYSTYDTCVDPAKLPAHHLWWDDGLSRPYLLLSDALHDAIVAAGLSVIPMKRTKVLKG